MEKDNIFLLSLEEYKMYKDNIPRINIWWWLRSPGLGRSAMFIRADGSICKDGYDVHSWTYAIRPALRYSNFENRISKSNDKNCFMFNDIKWQIIDIENKIAISVLPISFKQFNNRHSNNYENSYIRKWLLKWIK